MSDLTRRALVGALPVLGMAAPALAQDVDLRPETGDRAHQLESWVDVYGRPTARVTINGRGPFNFIVDTGSTTTVIAARRALEWDVLSRGEVTVQGATGSARMPLVELASLRAGSVEKEDLRVAVLPDGRLPREDGILGADVFAGRRLVFEIRDKVVLIEPSQRNAPGARPGNMRMRKGLLAEIEGRVGNIPTRLMLDTGAKSCIANKPLNNALKKQYPRQLRIDNATISGVTGHRAYGQLVFLPRLDLRVFTVDDASCIAADAAIFEMWGLTREPAMIIGVDLLSRLESFSIDYGLRYFDAKLLAGLIAGSMSGVA